MQPGAKIRGVHSSDGPEPSPETPEQPSSEPVILESSGPDKSTTTVSAVAMSPAPDQITDTLRTEYEERLWNLIEAPPPQNLPQQDLRQI
ncbi:MAG TPA: hypothetical protein VF744_05705, partial [Beijerinckiaceae bacterium]